MLWGLILEPYKRYSQTVEKSFHITNAALDVTTGDGDINQVMVGYKGKDYLICSLQKNKSVQTPLQLFFKKGCDISITMSGKGNVHLTGFVEPEEFFDSDEEDSDEEEEDEQEAPQLVPIEKSQKKRKADESPVESKKSKKQKKKELKAQKDEEKDSSSDDDSDGELAKLLADDETDENDESYIPNDTAEISMADSDNEDDDEDDDEEDEEDDDDDEDAESDEDSPVEASPPKSKKQKQKEAEKPHQNGVSEKKNKANKENEAKPEKKEEKKEKKVLPGNVAIEDLKVGNGALAKTGAMVQVYYEGRLKSNNKMFDSCLKGPGFKFKLGKKEVISGWDVGLVGMKVGGKRRIICPPGMAYGKKGSPPVIPPNSTLVFDVELKGIQ